MMIFEGFHDLGTVHKAIWTVQKQIWCADAQCRFRSKARRVIMRPGTKGRYLEANIFMASAAFKRDVLRILLSEFHAPLAEHSLGIKESFPRSSGHPTSRIRSMTGAQVLSHDDF